MAERFDVAVVGARCAGAPLAAMLADRGLRVCLVDKATFPSDTPSTHGIQPNGVRLLERLGIADDLAALTDPITHARLAFDATRLSTGDVREVVGAPMLNLRRTTLDAFLVEHAARRGVDVRTGVAVTELERSGSRVAGIVTDSGVVSAGVVVGADGTRSTVGRLVGAREYLRTEFGRSFTWGYFSGHAAPAHTVWLGKIDDLAYLASPTDGGLLMVAVVPSRGAWSLRDLDAEYRRGLAHWPDLAAVLDGATREGAVRVMAHGHGYFRESAGPGWVLVGDAGHFKDPTPGQGIADALRQAERLAPAIERALDGGGDEALGDWWRWRDRDALDMYWFAEVMGSSGPTPVVVQEMLGALLARPDGVDKLLRVLDHDLPPPKVFGAGLLARALGRIARGRRREWRQVGREVLALGADTVRQQWLGARTRRVEVAASGR